MLGDVTMLRSLGFGAAIAVAIAGWGGDDASTSGGGGTTSSNGGGGAATTGAGGTGGTIGMGGSTSTGGSGGTGSTTSSTSTGGSGGSTTTTTTTTTPSPCPPDMAVVGAYCIDRYEAPNLPGEDPLVMESATSSEAWCASHGKRLCTEDEWDIACEGPNASVYPYGDTHEASRCNDDKIWKAPNESILATWPSAASQAEVDKLWQGAPSGSYTGCVSGYGVYDMTGNVEEWVVRTKPHVNSYPHVLKGCYWAGCYGGAKPKCSSTNPAHADGFRYYETGFRCCKDAE